MNSRRANAWLLYCVSTPCLLTGQASGRRPSSYQSGASGRPAAPTVLQGNVGIDAAYLWVSVHSIFEIVLLLTLIFNWKIKPRRSALLAFGVMYAVVRVWTILYFAPSFVEFQRLSVHPEITGSLIERTVRWKKLNYIRTGLVVGLNIAMLGYMIRTLFPARNDCDNNSAGGAFRKRLYACNMAPEGADFSEATRLSCSTRI